MPAKRTKYLRMPAQEIEKQPVVSWITGSCREAGSASRPEPAFGRDRKRRIRTCPRDCLPVRSCRGFQRGIRPPARPRLPDKDRDRTGFGPARANPPPYPSDAGIRRCRWTAGGRYPARRARYQALNTEFNFTASASLAASLTANAVWTSGQVVSAVD